MSLILGSSMVTGCAFLENNEAAVPSGQTVVVVCRGSRRAATRVALGALAFALCNFLCWDSRAKAHHAEHDAEVQQLRRS